MSKMVKLIAKDTQELSQMVPDMVPPNYCDELAYQIGKESEKRGYHFISDITLHSDWTPYHVTPHGEEDTIYIIASPYESTGKIQFLQAKTMMGSKNFHLIFAGFFANYHPAFSAMWYYANSFESIFMPVPPELIGVYSPYRIEGITEANAGKFIITNGFPASKGRGNDSIPIGEGDTIPVAFCIEPTAKSGLALLIEFVDLKGDYILNGLMLPSPMCAYSGPELTHMTEKTGDTIKSALDAQVFYPDKHEDALKKSAIIIQTVPYSPRQMYLCSLAAKHGCVPIFYDPIGLYSETELVTFSSMFDLPRTLKKVAADIRQGLRLQNGAERFFDDFVHQMMRNLFTNEQGAREGGIKQ